MKKLVTTSFVYAIISLLAGAFYREFTKFMAHTTATSLSVVHTHLMVLGSVFFLILGLFAATTDLLEKAKADRTIRLYNFSVIAVTAMMFLRGVVQVVLPDPSKAVDAAISGVAGISHVFLFVMVILLFNVLRSVKPLATQE